MRRFSRTGRCGAAALGIFLLALVLASAAVVEARAADGALLPATPLILKDGRIANVAVHVLEFAEGAEEIGSEAAAELDGLTRRVATDCFLTAQVVGHVGLAEVRANDTLGAHRLARTRADAVQSALIGGGLPANAIASVWDWQFLVREPRATIWLFRLTRGEDCEGKPLEDGDPALVAGAEPDPATTATPAPGPDQAGRPPEAPGEAGGGATDGGAERRAEAAPEDPAPRSDPARATAAERGEADAADRSAGPAQAEARRAESQAEEKPAAAPAPEREIEAAAADGQTGRAEPERAAEAGAPSPEQQAEQTVAETAPPAETEDSEPERPRAGQSKGSGEASREQRAKADDQEHRSASGQAGAAEAEPDQKQTAAGRPERASPEATAAPATQEPARAASDGPEPESVVAQDDRTSGQDSGPVRRRTRGGVPTVVQPLPAPGPEPSQSEDDVTTRPAHQSRTSVVAAAEAAQPKADAESDGPMLVITFANNSSYFPPGTTRQLRSLIRDLEPGQRYRVRLLGAVSASDQVVGASTPEEAERYNEWLATRRVDRVESWLAENAADRELSIASEFVPEDNSREVTVRIAPAG